MCNANKLLKKIPLSNLSLTGLLTASYKIAILKSVFQYSWYTIPCFSFSYSPTHRAERETRDVVEKVTILSRIWWWSLDGTAVASDACGSEQACAEQQQWAAARSEAFQTWVAWAREPESPGPACSGKKFLMRRQQVKRKVQCPLGKGSTREKIRVRLCKRVVSHAFGKVQSFTRE